jgi:hypothetical protein
MRFLGLSLGDRVPDATTIRLFDVPSPSARERLVKAGAIKRLFDRFDRAVRDAGYIAPRLSADSRASQRMIGLLPIMAGQIVDASLVAAPRQRNTQDEKTEIKAGRIPEAWQKKPAKLRQKDRAASPSAACWPRLLWRSDEWPPGHSWTVKFTKAKPKADSKKQVDIAIPTFDYQNHVSIDREHGPIRKWDVTDAAKFEGAMRRDGLLDKANMASSALRGLLAAPLSAIGSIAF